MNLLNFIIDENEEKVTIRNEFSLKSNYEEKVSNFFTRLLGIMNYEEEFIYRIDDTDIDGNIKKSDEVNLTTLFDKIKNLIIGESFAITINVYKETDSSFVNIFSPKIFFEKINSLSIEEQLQKFQFWYENNKTIFLYRLEEINLLTESFCFTSNFELVNKIGSRTNDKREKCVEYRNYYCNYNSKFKLKLIPEDFNIVNVGTEKNIEDLKLMLSRLCNFLSLIYICDFSEFNENDFEYKIFGYKTINKVIKNIKNSKMDTNNLIKLVKWIYSNESSISDKLGITRNVLSLYLTNSGIEDIDSSILSSCRSNYSIFLKENVEKYIEVKTQQIVMLNSIVEEISNINDLYVKGFHQSLIAIFTFFFTTLLFNVISTGRINNIFTREITIISFAIIIISFAYMIISYINANNMFSRIENKYFKNKDMYLDIMDEEDIKQIFGNDIYFKEEMKNNKLTLDRWKNLWIIINVVLLLMTILGHRFNLN